MNNYLKWRKRKGANGRITILYFNPAQIEKYSLGAQVDFVGCFLRQMESCHGKVCLDESIDSLFNDKLKEFNSRQLNCKDFLELNMHRAIIEYCSSRSSSTVGLNCVCEYQTICEMLDVFYQWQKTHRMEKKSN